MTKELVLARLQGKLYEVCGRRKVIDDGIHNIAIQERGAQAPRFRDFFGQKLVRDFESLDSFFSGDDVGCEAFAFMLPLEDLGT